MHDDAPIDPAVMLSLWLSSAYPTGSFAYSHGLEAAAHAGWITSSKEMEAWLRTVLEVGNGWNDAIFFRATWACADRAEESVALSALVKAFAPTRPRFLETCQQGQAFLRVTLLAWPHADLARWSEALGEDVPFVMAFALAAKAHGLPLDQALSAYLTGWVAALVAAGLRLGLVGQSEAQQITARLSKAAMRLVQQSSGKTVDDLGSSAFLSDMAMLQSETVPSRLFRS
jgi:urease accessory protein